MAQPFYVLALPRSGTAWLANFLTYGDTFCYHDGIRWASSPRELPAMLRGRWVSRCGDADTGLPLFLDEVELDGPVVVIRRDPGESLEALARAVPYRDEGDRKLREDYQSKAVRALATFIRKCHPLVVDWPWIHQAQTVREIHNYLIPGGQWDASRYRLLAGMQVQANWDLYKRGAIFHVPR